MCIVFYDQYVVCDNAAALINKERAERVRLKPFLNLTMAVRDYSTGTGDQISQLRIILPIAVLLFMCSFSSFFFFPSPSLFSVFKKK